MCRLGKQQKEWSVCQERAAWARLAAPARLPGASGACGLRAQGSPVEPDVSVFSSSGHRPLPKSCWLQASSLRNTSGFICTLTAVMLRTKYIDVWKRELSVIEHRRGVWAHGISMRVPGQPPAGVEKCGPATSLSRLHCLKEKSGLQEEGCLLRGLWRQLREVLISNHSSALQMDLSRTEVTSFIYCVELKKIIWDLEVWGSYFQEC